MDNELRNYVWNECLPDEFKKEVMNVIDVLNKDVSGRFGETREVAEKYFSKIVELFGRENNHI